MHQQTQTQITLRRVSLVLALAGLAVAVYMTVIYYQDTEVFLCAEGGGCDTVKNSPFSHIGPVPVAALGVAGFLAILAMLASEELSGPLAAQGPLMVFGMSLFGVIYVAYLTYLEIFVIHALCPYCVAAAVIMLAIFVIAVLRMRSSESLP
jgi:uncharacterized membrane protein